ncbi:phage tail tape measure protein, partial [Streptococcus pyogenes]
AFPVSAVRSFERELANVQKITGFTDAQLARLGDGLVSLSRKIDVSAEDLAKIAAAAGQQGLGRYGVEGIRQFTETV